MNICLAIIIIIIIPTIIIIINSAHNKWWWWLNEWMTIVFYSIHTHTYRQRRTTIKSTGGCLLIPSNTHIHLRETDICIKKKDIMVCVCVCVGECVFFSISILLWIYDYMLLLMMSNTDKGLYIVLSLKKKRKIVDLSLNFFSFFCVCVGFFFNSGRVYNMSNSLYCVYMWELNWIECLLLFIWTYRHTHTQTWTRIATWFGNIVKVCMCIM